MKADGATLATCAPIIAESVEGGAAGLRLGHALCHELALAHGEVELELGIDFLVDAWAPEPEWKSFTDVHGGAYAGSRTLDTAAEKRTHSAVLAARRFRPDGVSV